MHSTGAPMPTPPVQLSEPDSLKQIIQDLFGPNGCPWDQSQTHESLVRYALEEVSELAEAIDTKCQNSIKEELGDLLLQVYLHSEIAKIRGSFTLNDVYESISSKMIRRHPHVFKNESVKNIDEVWENWEKIKSKEKATKSTASFNIPKSLSPLIQAHKIGDKTQKFNFDWQQPNEVLEKIKEEFSEFQEALIENNQDHIIHELGDLLFSIAQMARHLGFDSEMALRKTNQRFEKRFFKMLEISNCTEFEFKKLRSSEKENLWQKVKAMETKD